MTKSYLDQLLAVNRSGGDEVGYRAARYYYLNELLPLLPERHDIKVLEIGPGFGFLLRFLRERGYRNLSAIEADRDIVELLRQREGELLSIELGDALDVLKGCELRYDVVIAFDVVEHFTSADALVFASRVYDSLREGGRLILRTPNMAAPLGGYSRYVDYSHQTGFTEFSLRYLLEAAGFSQVRTHLPSWRPFGSLSFRLRLSALAARFMFYLQDRSQPACLDKNLVLVGEKNACQSDSVAGEGGPLFRNDDVSWDTPFQEFTEFCQVFWKYGFRQLHGVTLRGRTMNTFETNGTSVAQYAGVADISTLANERIREISQNLCFEERQDLVEFLRASPDQIALHGLYHTDYSQMTADEQNFEIREGLSLLKSLFPDKDIRYFIAPFNRTNAATHDVCRQLGLELLATAGVHLEAELSRLRLRPGVWYRYHHHRFYPESTFKFYKLSVEALDVALSKTNATMHNHK